MQSDLTNRPIAEGTEIMLCPCFGGYFNFFSPTTAEPNAAIIDPVGVLVCHLPAICVGQCRMGNKPQRARLRNDCRAAHFRRGRLSGVGPSRSGRRRQLLKLEPGMTAQKYLDIAKGFSEEPTFLRQIQRICEGLRKAGLPEGERPRL